MTTSTDLTVGFLDYAETRGFALGGLQPKGKEPFDDRKFHPLAFHSRSRDDWERWLANGMNLAIPGKPNNLLLLDIDVAAVDRGPAWGAYVNWLKTIDVAAPEKPGDAFYPQSASPSGGWHIYVKLPDTLPHALRDYRIPVRTADVRPLTDAEKSDPHGNKECVGVRFGMYLVAPGSYYDGRRPGSTAGWYTLQRDTPPYDCPPKLIELMRKDDVTVAPSPDTMRDAQELLPLLPRHIVEKLNENVPEGARSEKIAAVIGALIRTGHSDDEIHTLMETHPIGDKFSGNPPKLRKEIERLRGKGFGVSKTADRMFTNVTQVISPSLAPVTILPPPPNGAVSLMSRGDAVPSDTEDSLALSFADLHANNLRYVEEWGRWLRWDGVRWTPDKTSSAFNMVREHLRKFAAGLTFQDARKIAMARTVAAVERLGRSDPRIATVSDVWDADIMLLNTPSGVVDLSTGRIRAAQPTDYMTKMTAVAPGGNCPLWRAFLHKSLGGDTELISYIQKMLGYALTGDTREHALFFLYGPGGNGKSVLLNTVHHIMGDYSKTAAINTFIDSKSDQHSTDLAGLRGARLVTASETEKGRRWAEAKIKSLTGGDTISARFMRQDNFEFVPQLKLVISGNHKPGLRSVDEAIRRRFNLIPFTVKIPDAEKDRMLPERLKAEWSGILSWLIEGCLAWQRDGLQQPRAVRDATDEYLSSEDGLGTWIDERCVTGPDKWAARDALFASWVRWADAAHEFVGTRKQFYEAMRNAEYREMKRDGVRGFAGVEIAPPTSSSPPLPPTFSR